MATALAPMDVEVRLSRLRAVMSEAGAQAPVDTLVVTNLTNIRYLTGFTGSAAVLVAAPDATILITDGRYAEQASTQVRAAGAEVTVEIVPGPEQHRRLMALLGGTRRVGLEAESITWAQARRVAERRAETVATAGLVEGLRLIKDRGEVARIAAAAAIVDSALAEVGPMIAPGITEADLAAELDHRIRLGGAERTSFETIVASGPNSALPHARPGGRRLEPGDLVVIDVGAIVDGYCSDMTRTFGIGELPGRSVELYRAVERAQRAGLAAVRAGVAASAVDAACRQSLEADGLAEWFTHGTGHGVGLDIHEAPRVAAGADATLAAGSVVTVEPGVYLAGHGGVRIEDTVVVTDDGCEPVTHSSKAAVS